MLRQENMSGIATIHDPLRHIESRSSHVDPVVNVIDLIDRAAVNSHSYLNVWRIFQRLADFQRTLRGLFRTAKKNQRHPVSGWHPDKLAALFRRLETFCASHDMIQVLHQFNLFVDQQLRITDHVD